MYHGREDMMMEALDAQSHCLCTQDAERDEGAHVSLSLSFLFVQSEMPIYGMITPAFWGYIFS